VSFFNFIPSKTEGFDIYWYNWKGFRLERWKWFF